MDFAHFKQNVAVTRLFGALRLRDELAAAQSYLDLKHKVAAVTDEDPDQFRSRAENFAAHCSSGEGVVLTALLYFLGFEDLSDFLDDGRTWRQMHRASGDHRAAVAACIQQDQYRV